MEDKLPDVIKDRVLIAAYHLILVWYQYGNNPIDSHDSKLIAMDHMCTSAGEDATDFLESLGLAYDQGWRCVLTEKGMDLATNYDVHSDGFLYKV